MNSKNVLDLKHNQRGFPSQFSRNISLLNYVPELPVHLLGLERGLEALEELHHLGVHLEVGEVVVHPQQQHARHAVEDLLQEVVSFISHYSLIYLCDLILRFATCHRDTLSLV